jgi:hypothetical protein
MASVMVFPDRNTGRLKTFLPASGGKPLPERQYVCADCEEAIAMKRAARMVERGLAGPETRPFMDRVQLEGGVMLRQALLL